MHPTLVKTVPKGERWLHEIKWDGYRISVYLTDGEVRIYTRNSFDWTHRFPGIVRAVETLQAEKAVIDGEAVVTDEQGLSSFSRIQVALGKGGRPENIVLVAFDLLRLDGEDLRPLPLERRKARLRDLLGDPPPAGIIFSEEIEGNPDQIFTHACRLGLEGVVSKRRDSIYVSGRRPEWVKTKCIQSGEFIAIGYEPGKGFGGLGGVILAKAEDGKLVHVGGLGTGFNSKTGPDLKRRLDAIRTNRSPIPGLKIKNAVWARPEIIVEAEYRGITEAEGHLRHASFKGIREDRTLEEFGLSGNV